MERLGWEVANLETGNIAASSSYGLLVEPFIHMCIQGQKKYTNNDGFKAWQVWAQNLTRRVPLHCILSRFEGQRIQGSTCRWSSTSYKLLVLS